MEKKTDAIYEAYMGDMDKDFTRKVRERIHWICGHVQGYNVLDIGCSQGITSILCGRENKNVIGLDVEQRCIDFANESLKTESVAVQERVQFKQENFLAFKSEDAWFDTIIMTEVLEHIFNVEEFLEKAKRLLKVNGRLIVTVPFGINDYYDHKRTYYFYDLYEKLQKYYLVEQVEFFGKWIGYICRNGIDILSDNKVDSKYVNGEEKAFFSIERDLVDRNKKLTSDLKKIRDNDIELLNKVKAEKTEIQNKTKQFEQEKKEALNAYARLEKQLTEKVAMLEKEKKQAINECANLQKQLAEKDASLVAESKKHKQEIDKLSSKIKLVYEEKLSDYDLMLWHFKNSVLEKNTNIENLKKDCKALQDKLMKTKDDLKKAKVSAANWKHKREVLANSKLGRFTLNYWKFRDSLKRKIKGVQK